MTTKVKGLMGLFIYFIFFTSEETEIHFNQNMAHGRMAGDNLMEVPQKVAPIERVGQVFLQVI